MFKPRSLFVHSNSFLSVSKYGKVDCYRFHCRVSMRVDYMVNAALRRSTIRQSARQLKQEQQQSANIDSCGYCYNQRLKTTRAIRMPYLPCLWWCKLTAMVSLSLILRQRYFRVVSWACLRRFFAAVRRCFHPEKAWIKDGTVMDNLGGSTWGTIGK